MTALVINLMVKATAAMIVALLFVSVSRRSRASLRHLFLAALFGFLLLLPAVQKFAPPLDFKIVADPPAAIAALTQAGAPRTVERSPVQTARSSSVASPMPGLPVSPVLVAAAVYGAGAFLLLSWLALGVFRLRRLAARGEVWLDGTALMNDIALAAGIRRPALVVLSNDVVVPLTFGFRRSTIVLPQLAREWSGEELSRALRHELEHVRREDWLLQLAARAACAFYWPHPLVWTAWRRFCVEAERSCDDAVVGSSEATAYAGQLVTLARGVTRLSSVPALSMASPSKLRERVEAILDPSVRRGPHGTSAAMAVGVSLLALLVSLAPARLIAAARATAAPAVVAESEVASLLGEALVKAAEAGDIADVERLIESGVDINTVSPGDGTALIGAARGGQMHMIEYLLDRGANPNVISPGDGSPLIAAATQGYHEIIARLLDAGANIDDVVIGDENALMQSAWNGEERCVRLLLDRGANVNAEAYEGTERRTPLSLALKGGYPAIAKLLVDAGARQ